MVKEISSKYFQWLTQLTGSGIKERLKMMGNTTISYLCSEAGLYSLFAAAGHWGVTLSSSVLIVLLLLKQLHLFCQ